MVLDEVRRQEKAQRLLGGKKPQSADQDQNAKDVDRHAKIVEPGHPTNSIVVNEAVRGKDERVGDK